MEKHLSYRSSHLSGLPAGAVGEETDLSSERSRTKAKHLIGFAHSSFLSAIIEYVWFNSRPFKASFSGTSRVLRSAVSWATRSESTRKVLMCHDLPSTVGVCRARIRRGYGSGGGGGSEPRAEGAASHGCSSSQNYFNGGVPKSPRGLYPIIVPRSFPTGPTYPPNSRRVFPPRLYDISSPNRWNDCGSGSGVDRPGTYILALSSIDLHVTQW